MTYIASSARSSADARGCVTKGRCELSISRSRQPADVRASAAWRSKPGWGHLVRTKVREIRGVRIGAAHCVPEVGEGRGPQSWQDPLHVAGVRYLPELRQHSSPRRRRERGSSQPCPSFCNEGVEGRPAVRRDEVEQALAVLRHKGIEIDELGDPLRHLLGNARDHHAARAVADENHTIEVFVVAGR